MSLVFRFDCEIDDNIICNTCKKHKIAVVIDEDMFICIECWVESNNIAKSIVQEKD